jgi:hypothetical protein
MLRRFRLERMGAYERLVIAHRLAQMLDCFIEGKPAALEMGSEQGGIPHWDDFVVRHQDDVLEHVQIKRQITDFSAASALRVGTAGTLSALDGAFASLADWSRPGAGNAGDTRKFVLEIPGSAVQIKRDLRVSHLEQLCADCSLHGTTAAGLAARMATDGPTRRAYDWLTSWCGFEDWAHILAALRRVTVKAGGVDADLRDQTRALLARHFSDPTRADEALLAYIGKESADVTSITCPPVLSHLLHLARPELVTWTQYRRDHAGACWSISGTHGIGGAEIEAAQSVVEGLWRPSGAQRRLRVATDCPQQDLSSPSIAAAILRLALHLRGGSQGLLAGELGWRARASQELGHTLGIGESDLDHLPWVDDTQKLNPSTQRMLSNIVAAREEARALALAMDNAVWQQVSSKVHDRLNAVVDPPLLEAMEAMWTTWCGALNQSPAACSQLLTQMLYPPGEGRNAAHALRVGPKTVDLIVTAIETMLLVAVAVGGDDSSWQEFTACGAVTAIALKRWSGPSGSPSSVRELPSDGLAALLGPDTSPVVVLSGVEEPPSMVLEVGLADDASVGTSMGAPRQPQLLVTRSRIQRYLRHGTLESVRHHFRAQWRGHVEARQTAIAFDAGV